ncbi:adenylosuccinate synthase [Methylobacterium trifolii]|uniref:Uncharacterized protein n=1 Tax=Methylobacterium trifolii TaxID=1003092 RepID=A0ABQ4U2Q6_9HYPH|nr:adenylosuccinate synthase [Methylobacterium trifolii]GJE61768.1 hypothetical protein MPOCJGCO_3894 [Methylobacterium trifolii]
MAQIDSATAPRPQSVRIADNEGTPAPMGVDRLQQASPRLTPIATGQMLRRHRDVREAALAARGYEPIDSVDQGAGRGMEFEIGQA